MHEGMSLLAMLAAAVAAMIASTVYYMAFGRQMAALHPAYADSARPPAWKPAVELVRSFVLAFVVALLAHFMDVRGIGEAVHLAVLLWIGFPVVLFTGAVTWERVPVKLAAIHVGDWLIKLLLVVVIVTAWG